MVGLIENKTPHLREQTGARSAVEGTDMDSVPDVKNVIYSLSCVCHPEEGVRYVGLTRQDLGARIRGHRSASNRPSDLHSYRWMRKHGWDNIVVSILQHCENPEDLSSAEIRWISHYLAMGARLTNSTKGGEGGRFGAVISDVERANRSAAIRKGFADGTRPIPMTFLGKHHTDATISLISDKAKARYEAGQKHWSQVLTRDQAIEILALPSTMSYGIIAGIYGVQKSAIAKLITGRSWKRLDRSQVQPRSSGKRKDVKVHDNIDELLALRAGGMTNRAIAERFSASWSNVSTITRQAGMGRGQVALVKAA